jgi:hypothetical protein
MYEAIRTIMSLTCSCKDLQKGTVLSSEKWLNGYYSIGNRKPLTKDDLLNEKYFIKQNGNTNNK